MAFRSLAGTDVAELRVVLFTRGDQLTRLLNRRRNATQVGDSCRVVHTVQHLGYADFVGAADLAAPKVSRCQGGFQADIHDRRLDDFVDVVNVDDLGPIPSGLP